MGTATTHMDSDGAQQMDTQQTGTPAATATGTGNRWDGDQVTTRRLTRVYQVHVLLAVAFKRAMTPCLAHLYGHMPLLPLSTAFGVLSLLLAALDFGVVPSQSTAMMHLHMTKRKCAAVCKQSKQPASAFRLT